MPLNHLRVMRAVEVCRTATLGGHKDKGDSCGHIEISYNSCRNRHCPKCQTLQKEKWIEARGEDLLPIQYFHVVFTIPSELNPLVIMNQKALYNLMFRSFSETKSSWTPGVAWQQRINDALENCRKVVAVYSREYLSSKICIEEFNIACCRHRDSAKGILLPIYLLSTDLPAYMKVIHYIDCRESDKSKIKAACKSTVSSLSD